MKKLVVAMIGVCMAMMLTGCGDKNNSATEPAATTDPAVSTDAPGTDNNDLSDDVKKGVDDAADGINDAVDDVDDAVDDMTDDTAR